MGTLSVDELKLEKARAFISFSKTIISIIAFLAILYGALLATTMHGITIQMNLLSNDYDDETRDSLAQARTHLAIVILYAVDGAEGLNRLMIFLVIMSAAFWIAGMFMINTLLKKAKKREDNQT